MLALRGRWQRCDWGVGVDYAILVTATGIINADTAIVGVAYGTFSVANAIINAVGGISTTAYGICNNKSGIFGGDGGVEMKRGSIYTASLVLKTEILNLFYF